MSGKRIGMIPRYEITNPYRISSDRWGRSWQSEWPYVAKAHRRANRGRVLVQFARRAYTPEAARRKMIRDVESAFNGRLTFYQWRMRKLKALRRTLVAVARKETPQ